MAKFSIEVDTDSKTIQVKSGEQVVDVYDFATGCYTYCDCDGNEYKSYYVSMSTMGDDGMRVHRSIAWDNRGDMDLMSVESDRNIANEVGSAFNGVMTGELLLEALGNRMDKDMNKDMNKSKNKKRGDRGQLPTPQR